MSGICGGDVGDVGGGMLCVVGRCCVCVGGGMVVRVKKSFKISNIHSKGSVKQIFSFLLGKN